MGGLGDYHTKWSKSGRKRQTLYGIIYYEEAKKSDAKGLTYETETDSRLKEQTYGYWGRVILGVWDGHVHTVILKMDNQQGLSVQTRNSAYYSLTT